LDDMPDDVSTLITNTTKMRKLLHRMFVGTDISRSGQILLFLPSRKKPTDGHGLNYVTTASHGVIFVLNSCKDMYFFSYCNVEARHSATRNRLVTESGREKSANSHRNTTDDKNEMPSVAPTPVCE
jgi:hypothetical protein